MFRWLLKENLQMNESTLNVEVARASKESVVAGLNRGSSGNVSARCGEGFLVTPSGLPSAEVRPEQVVYMTLSGEYEDGLAPSSEWRFHRDIYVSRAEVGAVVHVHSPFAVSLSCLRCDIPAFHYMVAVAGGKDIRCAGYATFGTQALSDKVLLALEGRQACLMANHGLIATGPTLDRALALAIEVESLCEQFWRASLMGEPVLLTDTEMDEALDKFSGYGQFAR